MAYLLDTNVFIQAWNIDYRQDCYPEFWDWLIQMNKEGKIYSINEVLNEMRMKDNGLAEWVGKLSDKFFIEMNSDVESKLKDIDEWINKQNYKGAAVDKFKSGADIFLIAHALSTQGRFKVVTRESRKNPKSIKIPIVCDNFGIECIDTSEMLKREHAPFVH